MREFINPASEPLTRFRANAVRRSVYLAWAIFVILTAQAVRTEVVLDSRFLTTAAALVLVLALATATNWETAMGGTLGQWLSWGWLVAFTLSLGSISSIPNLFPATQPLFAGVVVLTGLALTRIRHIAITLVAIGSLGYAAIETGQADTLEALAFPAFTIMVVAAASGILGHEFALEASRSETRLNDLEEQQSDFQRLYAVSATLAGAESLRDGLPQMVGTICNYLDSQVGIVFLYRPERHDLQTLSPIWVNGHTLDIDEANVPLSGGGVVAQVFRSGATAHLEAIGTHPGQLGVIKELGMQETIIAPLKVEGHTVGVLAVGDPERGPFTQEQIEELSSLAAPAALVLSQLGRYEAAAEMSRRMREVAQMKTDFVSVVSHELRSPLTSIIGSLDTVARPGISTEATDDLLGSARRQARRLQRLIEDLLIVSRLDRAALPIHLEQIKLEPFLTDIVNSSSLEEATVVVEPADLTVTVDPDHFGRVFINLLDNAAKYAPASPVEVLARAFRGRAVIEVVDHGEGIPENMRSRIFERFTQLEHSDTRTKGGTGLGLSIVKGLTEAMGGQVGVRETPGGGATFVVSLSPSAVRVPR